MPDPIPGTTPEEEINPNNKLQLVSDLEAVKSNYRQDPGNEELRGEYSNEIEKVFQIFVSKYGEVKYENLGEYVQLWNNLITFIGEQQIKSNSVYDVGYRFEVDAVLNNVDIDANDRESIKNYLLTIGPYTTIGDGSRFEPNKQLRNNFIESIQNPQQMIEDISTVVNESRIHLNITHGPLSILNQVVSDENRDKLPTFRNITEVQRSVLYNRFPEEFVSIWRQKLKQGIDATWNSAIDGYIDYRKLIAQHYNISYEPPKGYDDEEHIQLLSDRVKKDFGVDMKDIENEITAEA